MMTPELPSGLLSRKLRFLVIVNSYSQAFGKNKCDAHCGGIWDGTSNTDLIKWAQDKALCNRTVNIKMESAVGTATYRTVREASFQIPQCIVGPKEKPWFRYAAKFACGLLDIPHNPNELLISGRYFTTINVHNPQEVPVSIRKRFSFGLGFERVGPLSDGFSTELGPARTLDIQCADIMNHSRNPTANTGFALIESPVELDVVSLYSAGPSTGQVSTLHSERVPARQIPGPSFTPCTDNAFGVDLSTGTGTWTVTPPTGTAVVASTVIPSTAWGMVTGAAWIGLSPVAQPGGNFVFETCFCRCQTSLTSIELQGLADNLGSITLNGAPVYTTLGFGPAPPSPVTTVTNQALFLVGRNCLVATVRNISSGSNPMGLALRALVTGGQSTNANGRCQ